MKGQITKILSSDYMVLAEDGIEYRAKARGKLRADGDLYVGDYVDLKKGRTAVIEKSYLRRNSLTRPYVANVDAVLIVVANEPPTDYIVVDKIILNAYHEGIEPILCVNKCDILTDDERARTEQGYLGRVKLIFASAKTGAGLTELAAALSGKTVALAGRSAVGKSSLINRLFGMSLTTGELSKKWRRGKNTTRHIEMFAAGDIRLIDTCGFSVLELLQIDDNDLKYYYDEYLPYQEKCRFRGCNHISEPDCAVNLAVEKGELNRDRYLRYKAIFAELLEKRKKKYD